MGFIKRRSQQTGDICVVAKEGNAPNRAVHGRNTWESDESDSVKLPAPGCKYPISFLLSLFVSLFMCVVLLEYRVTVYRETLWRTVLGCHLVIHRI